MKLREIASAQQTILVVVHPGSACGSADFNHPGDATMERNFLAKDIAAWPGGIIVIDGALSDELGERRYHALAAAIDTTLNRARAAGLVAIRKNGDDPRQVRVMQRLVRQLGLTPQTTRFDLTGAWVHADGDGCVGSVVDMLRSLGFTADIRDSALQLDD